MRISTKIILGFGILISLMAGLTIYQVFTVHRMQSILSKVSDVNFLSADIALQMMRDLDFVDDFTRKSFASEDPGYPERLRDYRALFETDLARIERSGSSGPENAPIQRLAQSWRLFSEELDRQQPARQAGGAGELPEILDTQLAGLKNEASDVYLAARAGIDTAVKTSRSTGRMAEMVSWVAAAIALLIGALVSLLIVQSISSPLKQLTHGTRAIAEGKFFYRLDTSRRDEFAQLAKDFNTMTRRLSELDQMKKDFVAHVSHELKAPLASMQETIQLLLEQIPGPVNEKQRRLLELNLAGGRRLSALIGNLLDVSRMEAGVLEYELKSNDLTGLVRAVAEELKPQAGERDLAFALEAPAQPVVVQCDADRIMQIIRNLLGNALKFSPKGTEIRVRVATAAEIPPGLPPSWQERVHPQPEGRGFALVTVADSGPGVPDEHKEKIFEKFHQVKQGKKLPGQGAGLGLAICRTIADAHRGAIWVEDNPEGGSIFCLMIPPGESGAEVTYRASSPI